MNFHGDISIQFLFFDGNPRLFFFIFEKKKEIRKFDRIILQREGRKFINKIE